MIELEIQTLAETREGLLIDVGGVVVATGFTLLRQRLVQDPHGALLTMVVRGPSRKRGALEDALESHERIISFDVSPFVPGENRPHFAASRTFARPPVAPVPVPRAETVPAPATTRRPETRGSSPGTPAASAAMPIATIAPAPPDAIVPKPEAPPSEPEFELDFILPTPPAPPPAPAPVASEPIVEPERLGPDVQVVDAALPKLTNAYPQLFARLEILEQEVAAGARESSLHLAGQRIGRWVFERDYAHSGGLDLDAAMESIAVPALAALTEVEHQEGQLHIHRSPLCTTEGHSGCEFFSGYLEGLLGPVVAPESLSVFGLCCRSFGADECVLAIAPTPT